MNTWFSAYLGDGILANGTLSDIQSMFTKLYVEHNCSNDIAVFTRHDSDGSLHCEVTVYFSPATTKVAKAFDAKPCERPAIENLSLFAGPESSWSVLFSKE